MINETYGVFCRDPDFKKVYEKWSLESDPPQEHHVPNIWGNYGLLIERVVNKFSNLISS